MHTFHDEETGVQIHYNGDMSGEAWLVVPWASLESDAAYTVLTEYNRDGDPSYVLRVPASALAKFGRRATIGEIASMIEELDI